MTEWSRRGFLASSPVLFAGSVLAVRQPQSASGMAGVPASFPAQDPAAVQAVVGASHGNFDQVRELVDARPALARANWDWGFGDWESALGAAAHTGNRDIAEYLIAHGARPNLFSAAMLGHVDVVRACVAAAPGVQATPGPHGITLMRHALAGGEPAQAVVDYLTDVGGADPAPPLEPLDDADRDRLVGTYQLEPASAGRCEVVVSRDRLMAGFGGANRQLFHLGGLTFYPAGVRDARITFLAAEGEASMRVHDGPLVVTGRRVPGARLRPAPRSQPRR